MGKWKRRYMAVIDDIKTARDTYLELVDLISYDIKTKGEFSNADHVYLMEYRRKADTLNIALATLHE